MDGWLQAASQILSAFKLGRMDPNREGNPFMEPLVSQIQVVTIRGRDDK